MKTAIIGDVETVAGFALGGISLRFPVEDVEGAAAALSKVRGDKDVAVLMVTSRFAKLLEKEIDEIRARKAVYPIVVVLPPQRGETHGPDRIGILIKRAVGINVEQQEKGGDIYDRG